MNARAVDIMEFRNPAEIATRAKCAREFCLTVMQLLTYVARNVSDDKLADELNSLRARLRMVCGGVITYEQLTENIGSVLVRWAPQIESYDGDFFLQTDLTTLISEAAERSPSASQIASHQAEICSVRAHLARAMDAHMRTVVLDALNLLITLYARYSILSN